MISPFYPFLNGVDKTIFRYLEQQFESGDTKLKPKLPHILNFTNLMEGEMKRKTKSLSCKAQLRELILICQCATSYLNPQNLTWITNFHSRILLADVHSKHILIILVVD